MSYQSRSSRDDDEERRARLGSVTPDARVWLARGKQREFSLHGNCAPPNPEAGPTQLDEAKLKRSVAPSACGDYRSVTIA